MNAAKTIISPEPKENKKTLSKKIRSIAVKRKIISGKIILDKEYLSDREWFKDDKIGSIFLNENNCLSFCSQLLRHL